MAKHRYPKVRKKARRSKKSYQPKTAEGRAARLANLRRGPGAPRSPRFVNSKGIIDYDRLQEMDAIQVAEIALGVDFTERPGQRVILKSIYGMKLDNAEREIYRKITTNETVYQELVEKTEAVLCLGARSGKSFLTSIITLYESLKDKWKRYKSNGETSYGVVIATRLEQAQSIIGANCARMMEDSKISYLVEDSWATALKLKNGSTIASFPANSTSARGYPIHCLVFDELAHFQSGASPKADHLIHNALLPRTGQFPGAKCLKISTPASKSGLFWDELDMGFKIRGRFTCQAATLLINPLIPQEFLEKEKERDIDNYLREFEAIPAEQVDAYLPHDKIIEACILPGDLRQDSRHRYYFGVDQSGLAGKDKFAASISHREDKEVICDLLREWHTKDGRRIMGEIKIIAGDYGIHTVTCDRFSAGWIAQAFNDIGLEVEFRERLPVIYQNLKSLLLAGLLRLPESKNLIQGLSRTVAYFGRNNTLSIAHPRDLTGHGDSADSVATSVFSASSKTTGGYFSDEIEFQRTLIGATQ
jgi:hypothetical protein